MPHLQQCPSTPTEARFHNMSIGRVPGATGIQPSIVTAKGDLIVATASGSVTNQAVGSNNQVLTADSAQADGVKWANGSAATLTTTGDLLYASAANTPARLAIGSTNQVLTVSGGVPTWATPAASATSWTLISSVTTSGANTITISGISGYDKLMIFAFDVNSPAGSEPVFRFNGVSTGGLYNSHGNLARSPNTYSNSMLGITRNYNGVPIAVVSTAGANIVDGYCLVTACKSSSLKMWQSSGGANPAVNVQIINAGGYFNSSSTISSVSIANDTGNFTAGSLTVYGSN
jgi:hypothetical protein